MDDTSSNLLVIPPARGGSDQYAQSGWQGKNAIPGACSGSAHTNG